jgi:hypothetical protein
MQVLVTGVMARCPVHLSTFPDESSEVAQVLVPGGTRVAAPTGGDEPEHDVVAGGQTGDTGADLLDDPGSLVAPDHGQRQWGVPGDNVLIRMAESRSHQADQDLAVSGWVEVDLLDAPLRVGSPANSRIRFRCDHPHGD